MGELKLGILFLFNIHHSRASFQSDPFLYFHVLNTSMASCLLKYMWAVIYFGRKFRSRQDHTSYICMQLIFNFCFNLFHVNSPVELSVLLHFENNLVIFCKQILSSSMFAIQYDAFLIKFSHACFTIHFRKDDQCFMGNNFFFPVPEMFDDTTYAQVDSS